MLYRIKPLAWVTQPPGSFSAETVFGGFCVLPRAGRWEWRYSPDGLVFTGHQCASDEEGKAAAEAFYRSRLLAALEPVEAALIRPAKVRPVFPISAEEFLS